MRAYKLVAVSAAGMVWAAMPAWAGDAPKWGAHVDLEGKAGTKRNLGEADLFLPLAQDDRTLLFADLRTRMDDNDSREGNFGLGLRHMLDSGWNLGGYGYFDRRRSEYHNYFNQMTVGAEALSLDWDVRVNGYVPVGRHSYDEDSLSTAQISGASVIFRGGEENSLGGFDAEIGWRVPVFAADAGQQLRVYAGGYRFADEGIPMVAGPRGRAEMVFDEVPGLWDGSRLSVGAEWQNDDPRGSQGFLSARLRIPLQAEASPSRLTPMERRMTDPIVRDIDIVAQAGTYGAPEIATASNGKTLTMVSSSSGATATALNTALSTAGVGSTVILSGTFSADAGNGTTVTLQEGQTVMGSGSLTVRSPSGRTTTLAVSSGATITGTFTGSNKAIVEMANNSKLTGMTLHQTGSLDFTQLGVYANGKTGVVISNNTINVTHDWNRAYGVSLTGGASATVSNNAITVRNWSTSGGDAWGIYLGNATTTISGNTISATGDTVANGYAVYRLGGSNNTYNAGSTGNTVLTTNGCGLGAGGLPVVSGRFYYTNSVGVSTSCQ